MKKIFLMLISLLLVGCTDLSNTPTRRVEDFLKKYQTFDSEVSDDLNATIEQDYSLSASQQEQYRAIMKKHYQDLIYEIKDDRIDGNKAVVTVEIEVTDLRKALDEAIIYMNNNTSEFYDETGNYSNLRFNDYRLEKLKSAKERVKYTIYINLTKVNNKWQIDNLNQITYDKINGTYNY